METDFCGGLCGALVGFPIVLAVAGLLGLIPTRKTREPGEVVEFEEPDETSAEELSDSSQRPR